MKKRKWYLVALCVLGSAVAMAQNPIEIGDDLRIVPIAPKVYRYTAWSEIPGWGRIGSNGMVVVDGGEAFLVDTPSEEEQTARLVGWISDSLGAKLVGFVPGHWHQDCVGGMKWLQTQGVKTYAYALTDQLLAEQGRTRPQHTFGRVKRFTVGATTIECRFLGGGHAKDNIVVWVPKQQILFGGCMVKDAATQTVGNIEDAAPLDEWSKTIQAIEKEYPRIQIVVPGHGADAGVELLEHTRNVLNQNNKR